MNGGLCDRRTFLKAAAAGVGLSGTLRSAETRRPRVAAALTEFTYRSHAHVILENFLNPYLFNGETTDPGCEVVAMYVDQFPSGDMARGVAEERKIPIFKTIGEALRVGGKDMQVDAVLSIGEHGTYPKNAKGQVEYPRKRFFDAIVAEFERSGRSVPVFNDKHLSYRWDWAKEMYDTSRKMGFAFMAGSSVPLAQRRPEATIPIGTKVADAVSIHGGPAESYDFHGLEVLQSMVEARRGGERGIKSVRFLEEPALRDAAGRGEWSPELAGAAMAAEFGDSARDFLPFVASKKAGASPMHGILLEYLDGFRATMLKVGDSATRWNFAAKVEGTGEPVATHFYVGPWDNRNLFKALSHAIQACFREKRAPYPVERTLLVTGVLDAAMDSRLAGGRTIDTPHLAVAYAPRDYTAMREMGKTWTIITDSTPQPKGLDRAPR